MKSRLLIHTSAAALALLLPASGLAQTLEPPYDSSYSVLNLGAVPGVPASYGGLNFLDADTLLIAGAANGGAGQIFTIPVIRDMDGHITGFSGTATVFADAPGNDGGLAFGPNDVLFFSRYSSNEVGQIESGSTAPDKVVSLTPLGVASSTGGLNFVPPGMPGAGRFKVTSYNGALWYDLPLTPDGLGTYDIGAPTVTVTGFPSTLEGFVYVPPGSPLFATPSLLMCEYGTGRIGVYPVDANGDPITAERTLFISGLTGAEGAVIDSVSGDFLFSTFGGGDRVVAVRGFAAITTTSTTTTTTIPETTTTTVIETTTTSTTTTTTLPPICSLAPLDDCRTPTRPGKASLILKRKTGKPDKSAIIWKWSSGAATTIDDLGDPDATSDYTLCLYEGVTPELLELATAPADGMCAGAPCWKATSKGFVYKDKEGTPDGVIVASLKSGDAGKAKMLVKAKGSSIVLPEAALETPLIAQLHRSDGGPCWEATYGTALRNDASVFKAKSN